MYNWDINKIKELLLFYKKQLLLTTDPTKELEIENIIYSIENLIDYYNQLTGKTLSFKLPISLPLNFKDIISDDLTISKEFGSYFPIVRQFSEEFDFSKIKPQDLPSRIPTKPSKIVSLASAFYSNYQGIFNETYSKLSSNFSTRLNFNKPSGKNFLDGETKPVYGTDIVFININKSNTIRDYITMIHESSHGITYLLNADVIWDHNKYCLREVDSLFFELIGTEYVENTLSMKEQGHQLKIATFKDYLYAAHLIADKFDMYSTLSKRELESKKIVTDYYKNTVGYNKIGIKDAIQTYSREYFNYIISYLTAIELYLIYQTDQEHALDLLYKIIMFKDLDNNQYLEEVRKLGIAPGRNIEQYFKKLVDTDRKLCYGKNIQL